MGDRSFLGVILTSSSHESFLLPSQDFVMFPESVSYSDYSNSFYYSDRALEEFLREAEKKFYFTNAVLMLVGDCRNLLESQSDLPRRSVSSYRTVRREGLLL